MRRSGKSCNVFNCISTMSLANAPSSTRSIESKNSFPKGAQLSRVYSGIWEKQNTNLISVMCFISKTESYALNRSLVNCSRIRSTQYRAHAIVRKLDCANACFSIPHNSHRRKRFQTKGTRKAISSPLS